MAVGNERHERFKFLDMNLIERIENGEIEFPSVDMLEGSKVNQKIE